MQNTFGKTFKTCAVSVLGCGILASSACGAEKDGAYMGVELGANKVNFKQTLDNVKTQMGTLSGDITANNILPSIGVKGGYKFFFGEKRNFGVRAYGAVGAGYERLTTIKYNGGFGVLKFIPKMTDSIFTTTQDTYYTTFIDYYVGADLLYNFAPKNDVIWGMFAGVGVGGVTWIANGKRYEVSNGDRSYFNFAANANLGLRATIKEKHGVELGARIYFPNSKLFEASNGTSILMFAPVGYTKTTHYRPFSVVLSYIYNF